MKLRNRNNVILQIGIFVLALILINSCTKDPVPEFSYEPVENPEAGDSIFFTNMSLEATSYEWDFGDETSSTEDNPSMVYADPGNYDVTLNAINEKTEIAITKSLTINEPTGFGVFSLLDDTATTVQDVLVSVYNNESDWENYRSLKEGYSDKDGFILFQNLESQRYIVDLYYETDSGVWFSAWQTEVLIQNQISLYGLPMIFYPPETKKSLLKNSGRDIIENAVNLKN